MNFGVILNLVTFPKPLAIGEPDYLQPSQVPKPIPSRRDQATYPLRVPFSDCLSSQSRNRTIIDFSSVINFAYQYHIFDLMKINFHQWGLLGTLFLGWVIVYLIIWKVPFQPFGLDVGYIVLGLIGTLSNMILVSACI